MWVFRCCSHQAPAFFRISSRDGTGFWKIRGSQDFSGRDQLNIFILGRMGSRNFLGWDQFFFFQKKKDLLNHCFVCFDESKKNPGILFSKILGSGFEVNPGIPDGRLIRGENRNNQWVGQLYVWTWQHLLPSFKGMASLWKTILKISFYSQDGAVIQLLLIAVDSGL